MPGAGAEMLVERVRKIIAPKKTTTDRWLEVHRKVHEAGLRSSATMMFGHVETAAERVEHLQRVRDLQDETGGFTAFICWNCQPDGVPREHLYPEKATPAVYLRVQALSRIFLDNVDNIQTSYVTQGMKMAQMSLRFGANDFGGTMLEENVVSAAGCFHLESVQTVERLIVGGRVHPAPAQLLVRDRRRARGGPGLPRLPRRGRHPRRGARGRARPPDEQEEDPRGRRGRGHRGHRREGLRRRAPVARGRLCASTAPTCTRWAPSPTTCASAPHGDLTYFNVNQHVNYTNVCNKLCRFCAFQRLPGQEGAYVMKPEEVAEKIREQRDEPVTEVHMVAGIYPKLPYEYYLDILRAVKASAPRST